MTIDWSRLESVLDRAHARGAEFLLETEGLQLLAALGIKAPPYVFVPAGGPVDPAGLARFPGDRAVVKVISPRILHKSDVGGVRIVPNRPAEVRAAVADLMGRFAGPDLAGVTVHQFVPHDAALGHELLLGVRWSGDFGAIVSLGAGGIHAEFLAANFRPGRDVAIFSPLVAGPAGRAHALDGAAVTELLTGRLRGQPPRLDRATLLAAVEAFTALAARLVPDRIAECEVNPLVVSGGELVALDVLVRLTTTAPPRAAARPVGKIRQLLEPRSVAIIGVSEKLNPGHIILNNLVREGFDRSRIVVVKPGSDTFEGCRAVPDIRSIPDRVDLFVLAVSAAQAPGAIADIVEGEKAESLIVIPGGLEEKQGSEAIVGRMREALARARASRWQGPVINGGNCLGIRSRPGRYDTMFIPEYKLPVPAGDPAPVAIVSQSGAFAITQMSKLARLNPKYAITLGNQMDLTVGDYVEYLAGDAEIEVFAVYVEGFQPLDGARFLAAAHAIVESGRQVILYRAGRTPAGAAASRSHTASIAGDYAVTCALAGAAGVVVAGTLRDFADLTTLFTALRNRRPAGRGLGAVSNAGFECVAIADNLGRFHLPPFAPATVDRLQAIFRATRIDTVVDVHNPIDVTPMAGDAAYEDVARAVLDDPGVHAAIIGCVPLTPALATLPPGPGHHDDLDRPDGVAARLARLWREATKPWVAVVDAGARYDPFVAALEAHGVPTFREADRALRLLNVFCARAGRLPAFGG